MKQINVRSLLLVVLSTACICGANAQQRKKPAHAVVKDSVTIVKPTVGSANNMMLNAASEGEPRFINVGLPEATGGTVVTENGMRVTLDPVSMTTMQVWRQDGSSTKPQSWNLGETAIKLGDVGVSMATNTRQGTNKFAGVLNFKTNSFGMLNGNISFGGPLKNNWFFAVNAFMNLDPSTTRANFARFLDQTQLYKGILTKRFKTGEINFEYGYMTQQGMKTFMSPYIYRDGKQVEALPNFSIGKDNYMSDTKYFHIMNPLTGEYEDIDMMKYTGSDSHTFSLFGKNRFDNGMLLNYSLRYMHARTGNNAFAYFAITNSADLSATQRYVYAGNDNNQVYSGLVQNVQLTVGGKTPSDNLQARLELSKKSSHHDWTLGLNSSLLDVDRYSSSSMSFLQEVNPNPKHVSLQVYKNGKWANKQADGYGQWNYNGAFFYYDGKEYKNAIYAMDKWKITDKLTLDLGARLEWHKLDGNWCPTECRTAAPSSQWVSGATQKINKNSFDKSFTSTLTYRILPNFGLVGDAYYIEVSDGLSAYKGSNDPMSKTNKVPYLAGGIFYNSKLISVLSRVSRISRSNLVASGGFSNSAGESTKLTFGYDIQTVGWTTDAVINPFKGFQLHLLLTLQSPKYKNFEFEVYGEKYNYDNLPARITSKTLIEIDPSYTFDKFRVWASARYFSKQPCSYPATLYFPSRWETFGGVDYNYNKNINFSVSVVNILNQVGAQGRISGTNTAIDPKPYYDQPIAGTYIRPFTVEFKTKIVF